MRILHAIMCAAIALAPQPLAATPSFGPQQLNTTTSFTCLARTGAPVPILYNPGLSDLGRAFTTTAGQPFIEVHPSISTKNAKVASWIVQHECGHHWLPSRLNSESRADCIAIKRTVSSEGQLKLMDVRAFYETLAHTDKSASGHLPGNKRLKLILKCSGIASDAITELLRDLEQRASGV